MEAASLWAGTRTRTSVDADSPLTRLCPISLASSVHPCDEAQHTTAYQRIAPPSPHDPDILSLTSSIKRTALVHKTFGPLKTSWPYPFGSLTAQAHM